MRLEGMKMSSGQTNEPVQQPPYPAYGAGYQPTHKQPIEYIRPFASDVILAIGIVVGLFLLMIGSIVWGVADTSGGRDAGMIVKALGLFVTASTMLLGAVLRTDMNKWVRVALLGSATLMLILIGFWGSFWPTMLF